RAHARGALAPSGRPRALRRGARGPARLFVSASRAPQRPRRSPPLYQLGDDEFLTAVQARYQPLPAVVLRDPELLGLFLPALRADFTLFDTYAYRPGEPLACPVSAFGGLADAGVPADDLAAWREQTRGDFRQRLLPG